MCNHSGACAVNAARHGAAHSRAGAAPLLRNEAGVWPWVTCPSEEALGSGFRGLFTETRDTKSLHPVPKRIP